MFPLYSDRPLSSVPFVTAFLLVINAVVFWFQLIGPGSLAGSVARYGMIPYDLFDGGSIVIQGRIAAPITIFTSMFMHGGFLHLGANMLYLWVFGRNVEDDFGHLRFLLFYLLSGFFATGAFIAAFPTANIPLVGASGAIAGILGAFFLRFPGARIYTLFIIIIFFRIIAIPAFFLLGLWFAVQIGACLSSITSPEGAAGMGGVAWISHVAGFVAGLIWTVFEMRRRYYLKRR